jgi:hypothetical protein
VSQKKVRSRNSNKPHKFETTHGRNGGSVAFEQHQRLNTVGSRGSSKHKGQNGSQNLAILRTQLAGSKAKAFNSMVKGMSP